MVLWRTYFVLGILALAASFFPWMAGDAFISVSLLIMALMLLGFSGIDRDLEHLKEEIMASRSRPTAAKKRKKR